MSRFAAGAHPVAAAAAGCVCRRRPCAEACDPSGLRRFRQHDPCKRRTGRPVVPGEVRNGSVRGDAWRERHDAYLLYECVRGQRLPAADDPDGGQRRCAGKRRQDPRHGHKGRQYAVCQRHSCISGPDADGRGRALAGRADRRGISGRGQHQRVLQQCSALDQRHVFKHGSGCARCGRDRSGGA